MDPYGAPFKFFGANGDAVSGLVQWLVTVCGTCSKTGLGVLQSSLHSSVNFDYAAL